MGSGGNQTVKLQFKFAVVNTQGRGFESRPCQRLSLVHMEWHNWLGTPREEDSAGDRISQNHNSIQFNSIQVFEHMVKQILCLLAI